MFALTLKIISIMLAVAAAVIGVRAAWLWYNASSVALPVMEPSESEFGDTKVDWIIAILEAGRESSELNQTASVWTAWAVMLSAASTLFGAFG